MITNDAAAELLCDLHPAISRFCRARVGARRHRYCEAEDVAQEVLLSSLASLPRFQGTADQFAAFVYGIARHKVADHFRERARDLTWPADDLPELAVSAAGPADHVLLAEGAAELTVLLDSLTQRQRDILLLRYAAGLTADEIAEALATTPGAVRVAQHRGLSAIRRTLRGERTGGPRHGSPRPARPAS